MGMDVYANAPIDPENNYWRSNIFGWAKLWGFVEAISPTAASLPHMYTNDGKGPDAEQSVKIANEIDGWLLDNGMPSNFVTVPNELDARNHALLTALTGGGASVHTGDDDDYVADRIVSFSEFCRNSGGFEVW